MPAEKRDRSRSPAYTARRRSRRLMAPSYMHLIIRDPDPEAPHITALRNRVDNSPQLCWTEVKANGTWTVKEPPPTILEAAQRRLALALITVSPKPVVDPAWDIVELIAQRIAGYDHWWEHKLLQDYGEDAYRTRATFASVPSRWYGGVVDELLECGWFSDGLKTLATGFRFEGDISVDMETGALGHCNGLYTVVGERKGTPVLYCEPTGVFCFRAGPADFSSKHDWGWMFTIDDPRDFLDGGSVYAEIINARGEPALVMSDCRSECPDWPVGRKEWMAYVGGDLGFQLCTCNMTLFSNAEVQLQIRAQRNDIRALARRSVAGIRAISVSGFTPSVGAANLCALRLNGVYVRQPDVDEGCPDFRNEWGHVGSAQDAQSLITLMLPLLLSHARHQ